MGLPGHRRTSSHKHRRASHFALTAPALAIEKETGKVHRPHRAAPKATKYRGIPIHVKGAERKLRKLLDKAKTKPTEHTHTHDEKLKAQKPSTATKKKPVIKSRKKETKKEGN